MTQTLKEKIANLIDKNSGWEGPSEDDLIVITDQIISLIKKSLLEKLPEEFKRQEMGNRWNTKTGARETYWGQSEEAVEYYNMALSDITKIIENI